MLTCLSLLQDACLLLPLHRTGVEAPLPIPYAFLVGASVAGIGMGLAISAQASNPDRADSVVLILLTQWKVRNESS